MAKRFMVRLRQEQRQVYKATVLIEADSESEAIDIAEETKNDIAISWREYPEELDERGPQNIEVVEAEELDEGDEDEE